MPGNLYVALGDSYSSGVGGGNCYGGGCMKSNASWAWCFAGDLSDNMLFTDDACSGATTGFVSDWELSDLDAQTLAVTITVGGNDLDFANVLTRCILGVSCDGISVPGDRLDQLGGRLRRLYEQINSRPRGRRCCRPLPRHLAGRQRALLPDHRAMGQGQIAQIKDSIARLNNTTRIAAALPGTVYVDTDGAFHDPSAPQYDHDVCKPDGVSYAWGPSAGSDAFHPTASGYVIMATSFGRAAIDAGVIKECGIFPRAGRAAHRGVGRAGRSRRDPPS